MFISYGQHDNARLLWQYGFVLPENRFTQARPSTRTRNINLNLNLSRFISIGVRALTLKTLYGI